MLVASRAVIRPGNSLTQSEARNGRATALSVSVDHATVVVDMPATTFCDSTALGVLVRASRHPASSGGKLRLVIDAPSFLRRDKRQTGDAGH